MIRRNVIALVGARGRSGRRCGCVAARQDGTITLGNRQAVEFIRWAKYSEQNIGGSGADCRHSPTKRRKDAVSSCSPKKNTDLRGRDGRRRGHEVYSLHRADADERREFQWHANSQRRARFDGAVYPGQRATACHRTCKRAVERIAKNGGTPLVVVAERRGAGRDSSQGHCQRRNQGTICATAQDGHQDGDDYGR